MATKTRRLADLLANIDDNSKVTSAGLLDATITAADLADDSVGAAEIIDDAVTSAAIATGAVIADGIGVGAVVAAGIGAGAVVEAKLGAGAVTEPKMAASLIGVKPHIIPGKLYPARSGLLTDNTGYTFTDSSATGHAITSGSAANHSGVTSKFGSTSLKFDGTPNAYISVSGTHADFDFQAADFTIEFWAKRTRSTVAEFCFGWGGSDGAEDVAMRFNSNGAVLGYFRNSSNSLSTFTPGFTVTDTNWHHYAYVRNGTLIKFAKDGVFGGTTHTVGGSEAVYDFNTTVSFGIFGEYRGGLNLNGYIDDIRITKGLAVYTGNFTAPTSTLTTTWSAATGIAANSTASNVKLLIHSDATGVHSGAYGTAQSDGLKYYYTDIKGSKPIKDPRIGSHFGSQRYRITSKQILEQETATHGSEVCSLDGREFFRGVALGNIANDSKGITAQMGNDAFMEITGYFNEVNLLLYTFGYNRVMSVTVDGVTAHSTFAPNASVNTPLRDRFVHANHVINIPLTASGSSLASDTSLGIHTLRIYGNSGEGAQYPCGVELIAQDTTSTATKSQIQIPSQNVVSYGKKFTVSGTPHYNPFAQSQTGVAVTINSSTTNTAKLAGGWAGTGATYYSSELDEATSLGLAAWVSTQYYRPVNGGRVVWWVNSSGTLKCSVNMMPPAGTAIGGVTSGHNVPTAIHNWATKYQPALYSTTIDHSQAEVAKTYMFREFGNGNANGSTTGTYKDSSMLTGTISQLAYVMDDGLTSMSANNMYISGDQLRVYNNANEEGYYITFIGTGISIDSSDGIYTVAQNLPYGTHIMWCEGDGGTPTLDHAEIKIDGVQVKVQPTWAQQLLNYDGGFTFHQPKMPPIPEDAVVIADYMLMADFVPIATVDTTHGTPSKGCRRVNASRDFVYDDDGSNTFTFNHFHGNTNTHVVDTGAVGIGETLYAQLPSFCTNFVSLTYQNESRHKIYLDTVNKPNGSGATQNNTGSWGSYGHLTTDTTLGLHTIRFEDNTTHFNLGDVDFASPIHTSSHYQTFETPFLHELVGGDRNMEQTNLVVTPDGKTWDQVTRDVSYIGPTLVSLTSTTSDSNTNVVVVLDECRGTQDAKYLYNKDFAISYDRYICLKDGNYIVTVPYLSHATGTTALYINATEAFRMNHDTAARTTIVNTLQHHFKRGDYLQIKGGYWVTPIYSHLYIHKA